MNKTDNKIKETFTYMLNDKFLIEDLEDRRLYVNDAIDEWVIEQIVYHIHRFNRMDKGLPKEERKPIRLYLNTPGGNVYDGYGLVSAICESITPIYTINEAMCASMGFLIFIAGHKRYSTENAVFLMHDGSTAGWDSTAKMKDRMDFETNQLEKHTKNYIMSRTSIDEKLYDEKYRIEWYMLPDEAKSHGICDYIVGKDCSIDDIL